jgi:uncharacterized protein YdaU (DUF1376 family)
MVGKMSNRAWMPLHIADYLADTGHLTATEHGAYLLMIMHYWQNGSLPANERVIARIAKLTPEQWEDSRDILAMLFGPDWSHKRIDAELSKADDIIGKRKAAAEARYSKGKSKPDASALQVDSTCNDTGALPTTSDLSSLRSESIEKKERERDDFNSWISSWPSQASDDHDDAFKAWSQLSDEERADAKRLSSAYAEQAKGGGRTVICSAAKYLRQRMWTRVQSKPPDKPPKAGAKIPSREDYIAAELRRSERSFQR